MKVKYSQITSLWEISKQEEEEEEEEEWNNNII